MNEIKKLPSEDLFEILIQEFFSKTPHAKRFKAAATELLNRTHSEPIQAQYERRVGRAVDRVDPKTVMG
jgi:hypothetical protein